MLDLDPADVERAVRTLAASESADAQVADIEAKVSAARQALVGGRGPIVFHQATVAVRVDGFNPAQAGVSVWNVGVLSRDGVAPPQAGWAISAFELVWQRDDWKIGSETVTPGPAPIPNDAVAPATSAELTSALAGFHDRPATP